MFEICDADVPKQPPCLPGLPGITDGGAYGADRALNFQLRAQNFSCSIPLSGLISTRMFRYPRLPSRMCFIEDVIPDSMGDLCYEISKQWLAQAVRDSFSKLSWRDQTMIKVRNAICWNCGGMQPMKEQYSFREISNLIHRAGNIHASHTAAAMQFQNAYVNSL